MNTWIKRVTAYSISLFMFDAASLGEGSNRNSVKRSSKKLRIKKRYCPSVTNSFAKLTNEGTKVKVEIFSYVSVK